MSTTILSGSLNSQAGHKFHKRFVEGESFLKDFYDLAEIYEEYRDGDQWSGALRKNLKDRGQQATTINLARAHIDSMMNIYHQREIDLQPVGVEDSDDPKADTILAISKHIDRINDADYFQGMQVMDGITVGSGWVELGWNKVGPSKKKDVSFNWRPWGEMGYDPFARSPVLMDARYIYRKVWMDRDDAIEKWPSKKTEILNQFPDLLLFPDPKTQERVAQEHAIGSAYIEKNSIAQRRIAIIEMQYRTVKGEYKKVIFSGQVFLSGDEDDDKNPKLNDIGFYTHVPYFSYRNRNGMPQGKVKDMISPQDLINSMLSKWQWNVSSRQIAIESNAAKNLRDLKEQAAKPDGVLVFNDGALVEGRVQFRDNLREGEHLINVIDRMIGHFGRITGSNDAVQGLGGVNARSFAQEAQRVQQGSGQQEQVMKNYFFTQRQIERVKLYLVGENYTDKRTIRLLQPNGDVLVKNINEGRKLFKNIDEVLEWDMILTEQPAFSSVKERILVLLSELGKSGTFPPEVLNELIIMNSPLPKKAQALQKLEQFNNKLAGDTDRLELQEKLTSAGLG